MSEQMEEFLAEKLKFGRQPGSVGEALDAADREAAEQQPPPEPPEPVEAPPEDAPVEVTDEPPPRRDIPEGQPTPPIPAEPVAEPGAEEEEGDTEEVAALADESVTWAKSKYGEDPAKWAKAAHDQERHISRLSNEKREAEELAAQWYQYAQEVEQQADQFAGGALPLSAQEEQWLDSVTNPLEAARQAAFNGKVQLYNGVIQRVAEENPMMAAQIGTQVQMELQQYAQMEQQQAQPQQNDLATQLGGSFQRLGLDLQRVGPAIADKVAELGEYNPYVQAIMHGDDAQRDLAVQAVYDLARATSRSVRTSQNIERENELRREAMVVQTGGVQPPPPPKQKPAFVQAMREEWERSGQYTLDE